MPAGAGGSWVVRKTNCWLLTVIVLGAVVWAKHYVAHDGDEPLAGRHRRLAA
jgi:hypothetical protein